MRNTTKGILMLGLFAIVLLIAGTLNVSAADVIVDDVNKIMYVTDGATYTIEDVYADADVANTELCSYSSGMWLANYSIQINASSTLTLNVADGCTWLKLNSLNTSGFGNGNITVHGRLFVNGSMITGWNFTGDTNQTLNDSAVHSFRPFITIHPKANASATTFEADGATFGYLGFNEATGWANKYGICIEDLYGNDNVSVSFNGTTITHNYIGVDIQGEQNVWVNNSEIKFSKQSGLVWATSTGSLPMRGTGAGAHACGIYKTIIRNSTNADSDGLVICSTNNGYIDSSRIYNNLGDGIQVDTSSDGVTMDNTAVFGNRDEGIYAVAMSNWTFTDVAIYNNSDNGLQLTGASNWNTLTVGAFYDNDVDIYIATTCVNNTFNYVNMSSSNISVYITVTSFNNFNYCESNNDRYYGATGKVGFWCNEDHNNTFNYCRAIDNTRAFYFVGSHNNTVTSTDIDYCNYSYYGANADFNTFTTINSDNANQYHVYLSGSDSYNTFTSVDTNEDNASGTTAGFECIGTSHNNTFSSCIATDMTYGHYLATSARDNTFIGGTLTNCDGACILIAGSAVNNSINNTIMNNNGLGYGVLTTGTSGARCNEVHNCSINTATRPSIQLNDTTRTEFYYTDASSSANSIFWIEGNSTADFTFCRLAPVATGHHSAKMENATNVTIRGYTLRTTGNDNNVTSTGATYQKNAGTFENRVYTNISYNNVYVRPLTDYIYANVTDWSTFTINASNYVGSTPSLEIRWYGLASGTYDIYVDGNIVERGVSRTSGYVEYTYTGGWSAHTFKVATASTPGGDGDGDGDGDGEGDGDIVYYSVYRCNPITNALETNSIPVGEAVPTGWTSDKTTLPCYTVVTDDDEAEEDIWGKRWSIPGFELIAMISAIGIALILMRKKRI